MFYLRFATEEIYGITLALHFILFVAFGLYIILNHQGRPSSAILWLLTLLAIPFAGAGLYLLFGVNTREALNEHIRHASGVFKGLIHHAWNHHADMQAFIQTGASRLRHCPDFSRALDRLFPEQPPLTGNDVRLLHSGTEAYPMMLEAIANARSSIHLQCYLIMDDLTGNRFFDALEAKAREGVEVRVLYDSIGSWHAVLKFFFKRYREQKTPHFHIRAFSIATLLTPWRIQYRNHRKMMIIDGNTLFVGGMNIADGNDQARYAAGGIHGIQDLHCRMTGPIVRYAQYFFLRDWLCSAGSLPEDINQKDYFPQAVSCGESVVRMVDSGPGQNREAIARLFDSAAGCARNSLWIMTPYFIPSEGFTALLTTAAARGVDVRLIVPRENNHTYVRDAMRTFYNALLQNGVRIYERCGVFSHSKAVLVDQGIVILGSPNCDIRSFKLNFELAFTVTDFSVVEEVRNLFNVAFDESQEITLDARSRISLRQRLNEGVCALLSPLL